MKSQGRAARPHAFSTVMHSVHSDSVRLHILHVGILTIPPIAH